LIRFTTSTTSAARRATSYLGLGVLVAACCFTPPTDPAGGPTGPVSPPQLAPPDQVPTLQPTEGSGAAPGDGAHVELLAELNELCPDTFCEGGCDYLFESLTCTETSCTLGFHAGCDDGEGETPAPPGRPLAGTVEVTGFGPVSRLSGPDDDEPRIAFHVAVGAALAHWEDTRP
jgi:hypothetical protein